MSSKQRFFEFLFLVMLVSGCTSKDRVNLRSHSSQQTQDVSRTEGDVEVKLTENLSNILRQQIIALPVTDDVSSSPLQGLANRIYPDEGSGIGNGNLAIDLPLCNTGLSVTYQSLDAAEPSGMIGDGVRLNFDDRVYGAVGGSTSLVIRRGTGKRMSFRRSGSQYVSIDPRISRSTLTYAGGQLYETLINGDRINYDQYPIDGTAQWLIKSYVDTNGNVTHYTRHANGKISQISDVYGNAVDFSYNSSGQVDRISDSGGRSCQIAYASNRLIRAVSADGTYWQATYTGRLLTSLRKPNGLIERFAYFQDGKWRGSINENGYVTYITYTANSVTYEDLFNKTVETFSGGRLSSIKVNEVLTVITRDVHGRTTSIREHTGPTTTFTYSTSLLPQTKTDPTGQISTYTYDARFNVTRQVTQRGSVPVHTENTTYNSFNSPLTASITIGQTTNTSAFVYDERNNLLSVSYNGFITAAFTYNSRGQPLTKTDASQRTTTYSYDSLGFLASEQDYLGRINSFENNAAGLVTDATSPSGSSASNEFDSMFRPILSSVEGPATRIEGQSSFDFYPGGPARRTEQEELVNNETISQVASTFSANGDIAKIRVTNRSSQSIDIVDRAVNGANPIRQPNPIPAVP